MRFLLGLPFSIVFMGLALLATPAAHPDFGSAFWLSATAGAASQILTTAALLVAMHRSGSAVGTALQQSSLPLAALVGLVVYHDRLSDRMARGCHHDDRLGHFDVAAQVVCDTARRFRRVFRIAVRPILRLSLNAFRHAALSMDRARPIFAAIVSLPIVQAMQAAALTLILLVQDPAALRAVLRNWRGSLVAGASGTCASIGWFMALALSPVAPVCALGVIEAPIAAIAGHRLFRETLHLKQVVAGMAVIVGIVLTSLW